MKRLWKSGLVFCALAGLAGCGETFRDITDARDNVLGTFNVRQFTDNEVTSMAQTLNDGEIAAGTTVEPRLTEPSIHAYARQMIDAHSAANGRLTQVGGQRIEPFDNPVSQELRTINEGLLGFLNAQQTPELDRNYLLSQIRAHAVALTLMDCAMIPNARNPVVDVLMTQLRADVEGHYQRAVQLRSDLFIPDTGEGVITRCTEVCTPSSEGQANAALYPAALRTAICR